MFVLINFFLQRKFKKYQKIRQKEIDKRLKVTTETLFNLKVLKLYSWEDFFLEKIDEKRENELRATSNTFNITNCAYDYFSTVAGPNFRIINSYGNDTCRTGSYFSVPWWRP